MSKATEVLVTQLREQATALVGIAADDFERFAAPVVRDLDLVLSEQDPTTRDQLQRALAAQLKAGVPELTRVTGAAASAQFVLSLTTLGADVLIGLVSQGAVKLSEALEGGE